MEEPVWASGALFGFGVVACGVVVDDVPEDDVPEEGLLWPVLLLGDAVCATNQLAHSSSPDNSAVFAFMKNLHLGS